MIVDDISSSFFVALNKKMFSLIFTFFFSNEMKKYKNWLGGGGGEGN